MLVYWHLQTSAAINLHLQSVQPSTLFQSLAEGPKSLHRFRSILIKLL